MNLIKLNLGCGSKILDGYDNIDLYITHPNIKNYDITSLPYEDDSVDEVLAEDILEHFPRLRWKSVLQEWVRVLKPGQLMMLQFPEAIEIFHRLINASTQEEWEKWNRRLFGGQGDGKNDGEGMFHYTGFTYWYLRQYLEETHSFKYVQHHFLHGNCYLVMAK